MAAELSAWMVDVQQEIELLQQKLTARAFSG